MRAGARGSRRGTAMTSGRIRRRSASVARQYWRTLAMGALMVFLAAGSWAWGATAYVVTVLAVIVIAQQWVLDRRG